MDFQTFSSKIQPWMLDSSGRFLGPQSGVNYAFEGMTPQQAYEQAIQSYQAGQNAQKDNEYGGYKNTEPQISLDSMLDPTWKPGPVSSGGFFGMLNTPAMWKGLAGFGALVGGANLLGIGNGSGLGLADATGGADGIAEMGAGGDGMEAFAPQYVPKVDPTSLAVDPKILGGSAFTPMNVAQPSLSAFNAGTTAALTSGMAPAAASGIAQFLKDNKGLATLGAGALGAAASGNTTTSASKDPWGPAQPYLLQNLAQNQAMSNQYNANPFSNEQKAAYQGLLNTVANSQAAGNGLLGMASNFGKSSRGVIPQSAALPTGVTAPAIDWSQYANFGGKR